MIIKIKRYSKLIIKKRYSKLIIKREENSNPLINLRILTMIISLDSEICKENKYKKKLKYIQPIPTIRNSTVQIKIILLIKPNKVEIVLFKYTNLITFNKLIETNLSPIKHIVY